jgi:endoglucanase Acf2
MFSKHVFDQPYGTWNSEEESCVPLHIKHISDAEYIGYQCGFLFNPMHMADTYLTFSVK